MQSKKNRSILLIMCLVFPALAQHSEKAEHKTGMSAREMIRQGMITEERVEELNALRYTSDTPDPARYGRWDTLIPDSRGAAVGSVLGMQTVHTILLPSGKVLMASGSSWRNRGDIQYYPAFPKPVAGLGLFDQRDDPFRNEKLDQYFQLVNNVAIYDPAENTFFRIPHPLPPKKPGDKHRFVPNDFFCTGHLQLPDGNPFFVGGTQYYFPFRTGARTSYIFDWREELKTNWMDVDWRQTPKLKENPQGYHWTFAGFMKRGRWYPTLVPLIDGRFVIFSGFVGFDPGFNPMYRFQINSWVEIFNPAEFTPNDPGKAWRAYDAGTIDNSPFKTRLVPEGEFVPAPCVDFDFFEAWGFDTTDENFSAPCDCSADCMNDFEFDAFKLYPNNYLLAEKKIYLSREGEWVSLRTPGTEYMRKTRFTYWMTIDDDNKEPISFERGPDRPEIITSYGTSFQDPNSGLITILGGQKNSPGTFLPPNSDRTNHFAGGRGSRKMEQFNYNSAAPERSTWSLTRDFLGTHPQEDRTMHSAVLLPTRQILVMNGGNYDFYGPILYPLLFTPEFDKQGQFQKYGQERMNEAIEPRLYHNSVMLLPDARVLVSGGNTSRATVRTAPPPPRDPNRNGQPLPDLDLVDLDKYFFGDGEMAQGQKGQLTTPTETWVAEIFSPPYLFIDGDRRPVINALTPIRIPQPRINFRKVIGGKTFYLIQSRGVYEADLSGLPEPNCGLGNLRLIKLPSFTHGWDSGQRLIDLKVERGDQPGKIRFSTPNAETALIPPGFYMLFYVDCMGKPSVSQMVRFDDKATEP